MENKNLPGNLFTIGYSGFQINQFLDTLNDFKINVIVDVRSTPYSSRFSDFNIDNMKLIISQPKNWSNGKAYYLNLKESFGAHQTNPEYYTKERYLDFEKFRQSASFLNGCERIHKGLSLGYNIVLMCAEIEPSHCHRAIMISRWFDLNGYKIIHILPKKTKTQRDIDEELLKNYFKKDYSTNILIGNLLSLDKTPEQIRVENIEKAYQKKNKEIGFRPKEEEEY